MQLTKPMLDDAVNHGVIASSQAEALWRFLVERGQDTPSFRAAHILYYLGGVTAIGAMTLFMSLGWERFGGAGLLLISLIYSVIATAMTEYLLRQKHLRIPAGITGALAVALVPLAVYGLQVMLGYWPEHRAHRADFSYRDYHYLIDWRWMLMELATLAAGALALWRYRLPFMVMPIAVTLWYMSMDLTPFLYGGDNPQSWEMRKVVSLWFGLAMVALALTVDVRSRGDKDYAFWLYLFGVIAFWGGLSLMNSESELSKFLYCCINLAMIGVGAALARRVFVVFGALGVAGYLGHLANTVFKDSMLFPFALTAIGLLVIAGGIFWQRNEEHIGAAARAFLPKSIQEMLAHRT